jgi:hypothetical protein
MLLVAMIANFFIQSGPLMLTLMVLAIGIFGLHPVRPETRAGR